MTTTSTVNPEPSAALPSTRTDPWSPEVLEEPFAFQEEIREAGPAVRLECYDAVAVGRHDQVHALLNDWQNFESSGGEGPVDLKRAHGWRKPSVLIEADPPRHDAPRGVLSKVLGPPELRRLRQEWFAEAERQVDRLLARSGPDGVEIEAVGELAEPFPLQVFPDAMGLPESVREFLLPYGDHMFNNFGPDNHLVARGKDRAAELTAQIDAHCARDVMRPGGFGEAIWSATDTGDLTPEQAPLVVRSLLSAGVDTTVHAISACLHAFATNPDEWARLRAQPSLLRPAFDEVVRWETPLQYFFRTTKGEIDVDGVQLPERTKVLMCLGAANRDPRRWSDPDRFDLRRDPSGHVGFGMGLHQCVGQHVARLEAEAVLTTLLAKVERIELNGTPVRHHNNSLRAWDSLPVRLHLA